jgi:hypothetical protein
VFPSRQIFGRCCRAAVTLLLGSFSEREDIVPHGVLKDTVVRNRGARLLLAMQHTLLSYRKVVLKKLREMKLGAMRTLSLLADLGESTIS